MAAGDLQPIYAVRAEAVPVNICAYQLGANDFRIHLERGIGWSPVRYTSKEAVLQRLLNMRSYGMTEAKACKKICTPEP